MKIIFNTIWVDDNTDFVDSLKMRLEDWLLDEKGLELNVFMYTSADGVLENIRSNDEIELIIVDYRLPGRDGDKLIEEIREAGFSQDIIFYSGSGLPSKEIDGVLYVRQFDGVFYVNKEDAIERIKELIELKLRRFSDPASVRGWIVADSIELESMVTDVLSLCFTEREGFAFSNRLLYMTSSPSIEFGGKYNLLSAILKDYTTFLRSISPIDEQKLQKLDECREKFKSFMKEIIQVRNAIAHQRIEHSGSGKVIKTPQKGLDNILLEEEGSIVAIRNNIRTHHANLTTLISLIKE